MTDNSDRDNDNIEKNDKRSLFIGKTPHVQKTPAGSVTLPADSLTAWLVARFFGRRLTASYHPKGHRGDTCPLVNRRGSFWLLANHWD